MNQGPGGAPTDANQHPDFEALLKQPGNAATVPALLQAMATSPPIPVLGLERDIQPGLLSWPDFLRKIAIDVGINTFGSPEEALADAILAVAGQLYLDDALQDAYGSLGATQTAARAVRMIPYLTTDIVIVSSGLGLIQHLADAFVAAQADVELTVRSDNLTRVELDGLTLDRPFKRAVLEVDFDFMGLQTVEDPARIEEISAGLLKWLEDRRRSLLFVGLTSQRAALFAALKNTQMSSGSHFAVLNAKLRGSELTRFLYARRIRPIWYEPDSTQLETSLIRMAQAMPPQAGFPPRTVWPVQVLVPPPEKVTPQTTLVEDLALPPAVPPQGLIDACLRNECVAFVGSGLAARAQLPTWHGFVEGLVKEAMSLGVMTEKDGKLQLAALAEGEINSVADNAVYAFGARPELLNYYRSASTATAQPPPPAYACLRKIPFNGVLTSNYDELLTQVYSGPDGLSAFTPRDSESLLSLLTSKSRFLLKLYGSFSVPDSVIYAPSEFQNLVRSNAGFGRFVEGLFFSRTLLFLGTSLSGLEDYLRSFQFPTGVPRPHYALIAVEGRGWRAKAEALKRRYNIEVLPFAVSPDFPEVDTFLQQLATLTAVVHPAAAAVPATQTANGLIGVTLVNIGPFKQLSLDFSKPWKVLLGDNGVGKSTILKSIALAIVGSEGKQYASRVLRAGETLGSVTLMTHRNPSGYVTEIQRVGAAAEVVSHSGRVLETEPWMALAFPPLRATSWVPSRGPQTTPIPHPAAADLLPILSGEIDIRMDDLKQWLINIDALSRMEGAAEVDRKRAAGMLQSFFAIVGKLTEGFAFKLKEVTTDFRVLVETPDGTIPIEALSQGLTSLLSWIGVVVQRLYEVTPLVPGGGALGAAGDQDPTQGYALILMDEIDAHMHPAWQQGLLGKLKTLLPNVQVIASTHSPLVVAGLEVAEILRFARDDNGIVVQLAVEQDMTEGRADQVLTGDLFGLDSTFTLSGSNQQLMDEYRALLARSTRTDQEEKRFLHLHKNLQDGIPPAGPENKLERRAQALVTAVLTADYSTENRDALRTDLLDKTKAVVASMGWLEPLGERGTS